MRALTAETLESRVALRHPEHTDAVSRRSRQLHSPGSDSFHSRVDPGCQELLSKQQQKALSRFFLITSLSKYLISAENKLHVTERILGGTANRLGFCF